METNYTLHVVLCCLFSPSDRKHKGDWYCFQFVSFRLLCFCSPCVCNAYIIEIKLFCRDKLRRNMDNGVIQGMGLCNSRQEHAECGLQDPLRTNKYVMTANHRLKLLRGSAWEYYTKLLKLFKLDEIAKNLLMGSHEQKLFFSFFYLISFSPL